MARAAACAMLAVFALFRLVGFMTEPWLTDDEIHWVAGEPFRFDRSTRPSGALKVVTWNIERGVRFEEILETLRALAPDVILLQEVDRGCRRSGGRDVARSLGRCARHELGERRRVPGDRRRPQRRSCPHRSGDPEHDADRRSGGHRFSRAGTVALASESFAAATGRSHRVAGPHRGIAGLQRPRRERRQHRAPPAPARGRPGRSGARHHRRRDHRRRLQQHGRGTTDGPRRDDSGRVRPSCLAPIMDRRPSVIAIPSTGFFRKGTAVRRVTSNLPPTFPITIRSSPR